MRQPVSAASFALAVVPLEAAAVAIGDPALPCTEAYDTLVAKSPYLAKVKPVDGDRLHFVRRKDAKAAACPLLAAECRLPAYLVTGDKVLVSSADDTFACVHFAAGPDKTTTGLVPTKGLEFRSDGGDDALDTPAGLGTWTSAERASITIRHGGDGYVLIEGDATRGPPSYNSGEIAGPAYVGGEHRNFAGYTGTHDTGTTPAADPAPVEDALFACRVRMRRFGPFLLVDDNDRCGGNGVTFSGIYVKR